MPKRTITTRRNKAIDAAPVALDASDAAPVALDTAPVADIVPVADTDTAPVALNIDAAPVADIAPVIVNSDAAPVAAPDAKSAFLERKATATSSAVSLYPGASLAVHRSDRQPADSKYLERVASPVQKIGPNGPTARDNSFILAVYDYLATYFGGDYSVGFNPANFGADLGTTSRAASVGYLALTDAGTDIVLTPAGITRGANLAAKRAKA
jgi:hypothetical protein